MSERSKGIIARPDGGEFKKFPNGMKAVAKGRRKYSTGDKDMEGNRSIEDFIDQTGSLPLFNRIGYKYNHKEVSRDALIAIIGRLESNGKDAIDINYMLLRFYAESMKVPAAFFVMLTHCVSIDADPESNEDVLEMLIRFHLTLGWLIGYLQRHPNECFHRPIKNHSGEYEAQMRTLYLAAQVYNQDLDKESLDRIRLRAEKGRGLKQIAAATKHETPPT